MAMLTRSTRPSAFAVFSRRNFALLWIAQFISTMGSGLTSIAAAILVYRLTGSALSVGLMLIATALPSLFVGLIAGVFVDRGDRKRIMVAADLIRAELVFAIPFVLPLGIAWLYIAVALSSAVAQFFEPAQASMLPETAPDEELAAANSRQEEDGSERVLEVHNAGDFLGEIAALTSVPRTASVIAEQPTTVLQMPAAALRQMVGDPQLSRLFLSKMTERMLRMNMVDLPRFAGLDQQTLRDLRTPEPRSMAGRQPVPSAV